jgi:conjugative transfer region protein TrbK
MRANPHDIAALGRIAGFVCVAAAIIVTAVGLDPRKAEPAPNATLSAPAGDPLAVELARCQAIGMAAQNDAACATAWAENRRRFFTYRPADDGGAPTTTPHALPKSEER